MHPPARLARAAFSRSIAALAALALLALPTTARAQRTNIVKPEFLLILDTSGSMSAAAPANSCGYSPANRINAAACVVRNLADATGEATFGLQTFAMSCSSSATNHYSYGPGIGCGDADCNNTFPTSTPASRAWPAYPFDFYGCSNAGNVQVPVSEGREYELRSWGDGNFSSCTMSPAPGAVGGNELSYAGSTNGAAVSNTPLAGSLRVAADYLRGNTPGVESPYRDFNGTGEPDPYPGCRPVNIILLTDGEECCGARYNNDCEYTNRSMGAELNARNIGCLQVDLNNNGRIDDPIPTSDPNPSLRGRYESNIDLNRDGDCYDAGEQRAFKTRVYVIGFGITCSDTGRAFTSVESIARAGGVSAHRVSCISGNRFGYYAQSEADIALAINQIVADSALIERCNGRDDNCNAVVDEGFDVGPVCSAGVGACRRDGARVCTADGTGTQCSATPGPASSENNSTACTNGIDDDCDGLLDCGDPDCASLQACRCTPSPEICDGRDNDCDGRIDEGNLTRPCGVAIGECTVGTQTCQEQTSETGEGRWSDCTGRMPSMEICDNRDNNCNGVADEGVTRPCGAGTGECRGIQRCVGGTFDSTCLGALPPSAEICDGLDNNCNGMVDEGLTDLGSCGLGGSMGVGICRTGTVQCVMGRPQCVGGVSPRTEECNNLDDDCNGIVDDGIAAGATCSPMGVTIPVDRMGNPVGACRLGRLVCRTGTQSCEGAIGPTTEVCNGRDDDCDGVVDEGLDGTPCGMTRGECRQGTIRCSMGREFCEGGRNPRPEECNCRDDDCDGVVDNMPASGSPLCGGGAVCAGAPYCMCLRECADGEFPCPTGRVCAAVDGRRVCASDRCINVRCPDASQVCNPSTGMCEERCAGMEACPDALVRDPVSCACVRNDCTTTMRCAEGEICRGGACIANACNPSPCDVGQACFDGECRTSCATGVGCGEGYYCNRGECVEGADPCAGVTCEANRFCDPATGECRVDQCSGLNRCPADRNQVCDPATGMCVDDPCASVTCPFGQRCDRGDCVSAGPMDGGVGGRVRVISSGGGGIACSVNTPGSGDGNGAAALFALVAGLAMVGARARKRNAARGAAVEVGK